MGTFSVWHGIIVLVIIALPVALIIKTAGIRNSRADSLAETDGPSGLGGWLILPAIGLIFSPPRLLAFVFTDILPIFEDGSWEVLTTPGTEIYHPLWAPMIILELFGNLFFAGFALILIVLFFSKSRRFPALMIAFLVSNLGFIVLDYVVGGFIPALAEMSDPEGIKEIGRGVGGVMVWVPYFLFSERVKNTFA